MARTAETRFWIRGWQVEPQLNLLKSAQADVRIEPRAMQVLLFLSEHAGRVVSKRQLIESVWEGAFVTDEALTYAIWELRKALGDDARSPRFIQTIPKKGYRLVAVVRRENGVAHPSDAFPAEPREEGTSAHRRERSQGAAFRIALGLAIVGMGLAGWFYLRTLEPAPPFLRTIPVTTYPGEEWDPAVSPDGRLIAFTRTGDTGTRDLFVKQVGGGEPLRLSPGDLHSPAWSPDGQRLAFLRKVEASETEPSDGLFVVPSLGGVERQIGVFRSRHGISWSLDGKVLALSHREGPERPSSIHLVSIETGDRRNLTTPPPHSIQGDTIPRFSPDGKTVAFCRGGGSGAEIYLVTVEGEDERRLTFENNSLQGLDWAPDGKSLVFSAGRSGRAGYWSLWRISASGGQPEPLAVGEQGELPSVSRHGNRLAYVRRSNDWNIWRAPLRSPPTGAATADAERRLIAATGLDYMPQYSPDGTEIAFTSSRSGSLEIWICDGDGSNARQLTFLEHPLTADPAWSPDGRTIAFMSSKEGSWDIYVVDATGGVPRRLTTESWNEHNARWSQDGSSIYFHSNRSGRREIWKLPAEGGDAVRVTQNEGTIAVESLEGAYVYFAKSTANWGPEGIWRMPIDGGDEELILGGVRTSDWTFTNRGIYYVNREAEARSIEFFDLATGEVSSVAELAHSPLRFGLSVSPDEKWILYVRDASESDIMVVDNFR